MIRKFCLIILVWLFLSILSVFSAETCGRTAIINNQEVLMDISSSSKGEGLRPFLERDAVAKSYLDRYQEEGFSRNRNAVVGTLGVTLLLGAVLTTEEGRWGPFREQELIAGGLSLLFVNFLLAKGIEARNENLLRRSIDEYNKRNRPKIYFLPGQNRRSPSSAFDMKLKLGPMVGWRTSF
ncbi:MAG: hypothetical protein OXB88_00500 [Bacteriovoracales bacterium]|nr:hypothetical protein [Bacteriovoracales bacterium]